MSKKILFKNFDWVLFAVVGLLISFGLLTIYSTAFAETDAKGNKAISQAVFAALGFILVFVFAKIDYRVFRKFTGLFYVIMIALLLVVEFAGSNVLGATRWINLGFFQLQPSEVAKIISIIILAKYFSDHNEEMWRVKHHFGDIHYNSRFNGGETARPWNRYCYLFYLAGYAFCFECQEVYSN